MACVVDWVSQELLHHERNSYSSLATEDCATKRSYMTPSSFYDMQ
jgi:hypothetical protein